MKLILFWRGIEDEDIKDEHEEDDNGKHKKKERSAFIYLLIIFDLIAVLAQVSGSLLWCLLQYLDLNEEGSLQHPYPWALPVSVILTSFGYWENFTEKDSWTSLGKLLWRIRNEMYEKVVRRRKRVIMDADGFEMRNDEEEEEYEEITKPGTRHRVYTMVIPFKILAFYVSMVLITWWTDIVPEPSQLSDYFSKSYGNHTHRVTTVQLDEIAGSQVFDDGIFEKKIYKIYDTTRHPLWVLLVQVFSTYLAYFAVKFASKVWIQSFSFASPITLALPVTLIILESFCGARANDKCAFEHSSFYIPNRLFFECPTMGDYYTYLWSNHSWIAVIWFLSYLWINIHIWYPKSPRLARSDKLFCTPWYEGLFIDQSLVMNRRADGDKEITASDIDDHEDEATDKRRFILHDDEATSSMKSSVKGSDKVTRIYACATMWHEAKDEMLEMLKSIFRIDSDYSSRRIARLYMDVKDPDFYEWETHIFFDNCFELDKSEGEMKVNEYVIQLCELMDVAASRHFKKKVRVKPPTKIPTPYGGQLIWTLPGKTNVVVHLKDVKKIRIKKRWSQIMYMYYLLGYKIMEEKKNFSGARLDTRAENTFLLALDGDIDFQPNAVLRLVDMMKRNKVGDIYTKTTVDYAIVLLNNVGWEYSVVHTTNKKCQLNDILRW